MLFNPTRPLIGFPIPCDGHATWGWLGGPEPSPSGRLVSVKETLDNELRGVASFKYADYHYVMDVSSNLVRHVLKHAPIENKHRNVLVDVKLHELKRGQYACVPGWHLDGSINHPEMEDKRPELHHLFVASQFARTEFIDMPFELHVDPKWTFAERSNKIGGILDEMSVPIFTIPNCTFVTYDDTFFHRGAQATGDELRLLIRVTETDVIKPQNRIYTPYTHSLVTHRMDSERFLHGQDSLIGKTRKP